MRVLLLIQYPRQRPCTCHFFLLPPVLSFAPAGLPAPGLLPGPLPLPPALPLLVRRLEDVSPAPPFALPLVVLRRSLLLARGWPCRLPWVLLALLVRGVAPSAGSSAMGGR